MCWFVLFPQNVSPEQADYCVLTDYVCVLFPQNVSPEQADYCIKRMKPYVDPKTGRPVPDAYDYVEFTRDVFIN